MAENKYNKKEEIDLLEIFYAIWNGIVKLFKTAIDLVVFLFVFGFFRVHWLILFCIVGAGMGFLMFQNTDRYYSSEMIAQPNGFSSVDMAQYINDIQKMCERNNFEAIAKTFGISSSNAKQISSIAAYHFIDVNGDNIGDMVDYKYQYNPEDSTKLIIMNRILIRAEVINHSIFDEIRTGLITYIQNNPYLLKVNEIRKAELRDLITQSENEIVKLDSLQNFEYYRDRGKEMPSRNGQLVFMNEKQTQLYYQDKVNLLQKKLAHQKALELATDPITIIKDFTELQIEENPLSSYLIKFGFTLVILGYFFMMLLHFRKSIFSYLSSKR